jgi:KDO2-lipid IV(A) lauroyltransferase
LSGHLSAALAATLLRLLALLPLRVAQFVGVASAVIVGRSGARIVRATRINIEACFSDLPPAARERLVQASLRASGRLVAELGMVWYWPTARWRKQIDAVHGAEVIVAALADKRGVLLLVPHYGNWELLNLYLGDRFGIVAMYTPVRSAALDMLVRAQRVRHGSELVRASLTGIRTLYRALADGRLVGVLPDQVPTGSGVFAPFFGRPARTMTLPQRLVRQTDALAVLGYARRTPRGRFEIAFEPISASVFTRDADACASAINAAIETVVRRDPAQYQWEYKRFKHGPPSLPRLY